MIKIIWMVMALMSMAACDVFTGPAGKQGAAGVVGTTGTTGAEGQTGAMGPQGVVGATGSQGVPGVAGPQGPQGDPGQSPAPIQFCADQGPTVYPTHFSEYGLCIAGNLYGVFYDGVNAWLAELPPGTYMSTATGLKCTFVIESGCAVKEQQ